MPHRARLRRIAIAALAAGAVALGAAPVGAVDESPGQPLTAGVTDDDFYRPPGDQRMAAATEAGASTDVVQQLPPLSAQYVAQSVEFTGDPLGIVVYPLESRRYTLGSDKIGVYVCTWPGAPGSAELGAVTTTLNGAVKDYFVSLSGGRYTPVFTARQTVTIGVDEDSDGFVDYPISYFGCADKVEASVSVTTDTGILAVLNNQSNGGLATSGWFCDVPCDSDVTPNTFPANNRWAVVDGGSVSTPDFVPPYDEPHLTTAVHEIGHTLGWPHSYSAETANEYDDPIDVMSGNMPESLAGRVDTPYGTNAFNRYRAGWIDPAQVLVYTGGVETVTIAPAGVAGIQMVALPTEVEWSFIVLDSRRSVGVDAIPDSFQGVTSHYVEQMCPFGVCWGTAAGMYSYPPSPFGLDHVTATGGTLNVDYEGGAPAIADGTLVKVLSGSDAGYVVKLVGFADVGSSTFLADILWLADEGITKGCDDTEFCPSGNVTRGQMAAFLVRALGLTASDPAIEFVDDDDSIFEADIEKLATAGITRGCNPPANDRFCPDQPVSRGQMAAFLVRAFGLTDQGSVDFTDDDDSIFEADIEKLATAGITKGCNPPSNTQFCPGQSVTRGQMAAFLHRSEGYLP